MYRYNICYNDIWKIIKEESDTIGAIFTIAFFFLVPMLCGCIEFHEIAIVLFCVVQFFLIRILYIRAVEYSRSNNLRIIYKEERPSSYFKFKRKYKRND